MASAWTACCVRAAIRLAGILNGIDTDEYNPATDPLIYANYSLRAPSKQKAVNKTALQEELGLKVDPNVPLIGMVGRLSSQKGLELVEGVLPELMATGAQIVGAGQGRRQVRRSVQLGTVEISGPARGAHRDEPPAGA